MNNGNLFSRPFSFNIWLTSAAVSGPELKMKIFLKNYISCNTHIMKKKASRKKFRLVSVFEIFRAVAYFCNLIFKPNHIPVTA